MKALQTDFQIYVLHGGDSIIEFCCAVWKSRGYHQYLNQFFRVVKMGTYYLHLIRCARALDVPYHQVRKNIMCTGHTVANITSEQCISADMDTQQWFICTGKSYTDIEIQEVIDFLT